jgi:hypothetical protein
LQTAQREQAVEGRARRQVKTPQMMRMPINNTGKLANINAGWSKAIQARPAKAAILISSQITAAATFGPQAHGKRAFAGARVLLPVAEIVD